MLSHQLETSETTNQRRKKKDVREESTTNPFSQVEIHT